MRALRLPATSATGRAPPPASAGCASLVVSAPDPQATNAIVATSAAVLRSGMRREAISRLLPRNESLVELPDLEDLCAAIGTRALNRSATVLHGHLLRILDLDLLLLLDAVTLSHDVTS